MRFVVCVKQVPETTDVRIDPATNTLLREGIPSIMNPFDTHAVEEALRFREALGGTVTAVTMGPPQAAEVLREAVGMGADEALLLTDPAFRGSDTLATSRVLAAAIGRLDDVRVVLCGKQAIDGDTAQVGPEVAELLDIPQVTYVRTVRELADDSITVERMVEGGYTVVRSSLPVLLTVVKDINEPRVQSLRGLMRAKRTDMTTWGLDDLSLDPHLVGLDGSPTQVVRVFTPEMSSDGEIFEGDPRQQARAVVARLRDSGIL